jgi:hypothetical protein
MNITQGSNFILFLSLSHTHTKTTLILNMGFELIPKPLKILKFISRKKSFFSIPSGRPFKKLTFYQFKYFTLNFFLFYRYLYLSLSLFLSQFKSYKNLVLEQQLLASFSFYFSNT